MQNVLLQLTLKPMFDIFRALISTKDCRSWIVIDIRIRSSAYMNELQQNELIKQPILEFSSFNNRSSTLIANRIGDKIPPCLTPE